MALCWEAGSSIARARVGGRMLLTLVASQPRFAYQAGSAGLLEGSLCVLPLATAPKTNGSAIVQLTGPLATRLMVDPRELPLTFCNSAEKASLATCHKRRRLGTRAFNSAQLAQSLYQRSIFMRRCGPALGPNPTSPQAANPLRTLLTCSFWRLRCPRGRSAAGASGASLRLLHTFSGDHELR